MILDVRTGEEFSAGRIPGAKNLDYHSDTFDQDLASLEKSKSYLIHCASGGRSAQALKKMAPKQFGEVYHLSAGFNGWQQAGKPVER